MIPEHLYVIVPSMQPTGPVKGAVALCNGLSGRLSITLVVLKETKGDKLRITPDIRILSLEHMKGWRDKRGALQEELDAAGGRAKVACVSFCLSADAMNYSMRRYAFIASSIRGNLPQNYRFDYGPLGRIVAWIHLLALHRFDRVITMSMAMTSQLKRFGLRRLTAIGNFVDEIELEQYRNIVERSGDKVRFLFLASLSKRKRPELLLASASELLSRGLDFHIDMVGAGPLETSLREQVKELELERHVTFHGQIAQPFEMLQQVDYLVIPSESEGISRAAMEALFFGVPCILRDVDANRELINPDYNGALFHGDQKLVDVMSQAIEKVMDYWPRGNLLPSKYRQQQNVESYLESLHR